MEIKKLISEILHGKIFIYPTDTVYGLGCDATNKSSIEKIKTIKQRERDKPLSVIAPNLNWIKKNFVVDFDLNKYLPGPYTVILKKKDKTFLSWISDSETLGIRIPNNKICQDIQKSGVPFVTTSVNLSGEPFAIKISDIKSEIKNKVDYVIETDNENELSGKPSTLIINGKEVERK